MYSRVAGLIGLRNRGALVGGAVVYNDELKVFQGLTQYRFNSPCHKRLPIIGEHDYADFWVIHGRPSPFFWKAAAGAVQARRHPAV